MSGDVFGNGMLLSKSIKLVAAFDHRHIFIDPDPDPATSWKERKRHVRAAAVELGRLRPQADLEGRRRLPAHREVDPAQRRKRARRSASTPRTLDPATLINAILKAPVDLLWFGGIGTYIKASDAEPGRRRRSLQRRAPRQRATKLRAKVIGEGANLGITQAGRIEFAERGGRINTDFIDNSAGVDCSDNEVNIKIPLNREMREGRLSFDKRNTPARAR